MPFWDGNNLKKNLETLSKLKVGEKIGFDAQAGELKRNGFGQSITRMISGDSLLDKEGSYRKNLGAIFEHAAVAHKTGKIDTILMQSALFGLKTQIKTYAGKRADAAKWGSADAYQKMIGDTIAHAEQVCRLDWKPNPDMLLPDAADSLPTMIEFRQGAGSAVQTPDLNRLGTLLQLCSSEAQFEEDTRESYAKFYLYGDLYFTSDHWLKNQGKGPAQPLVERVYKSVVKKLCKSFVVPVNVLPEKLVSFFGCKFYKDATYNYAKSDPEKLKAGTLQYLTRAEALKYRLTFDNGLAYQYPWWVEEAGRKLVRPERVLADSGRATELDFAVDHVEGQIASCVLSMSRDLYMYAHRSAGVGGHKTAFYHSSYTAGDPVLVAGGMKILRGQVTSVTLGSGHFRPNMHKMLNWLECLKMNRVDLRNVRTEVNDPRDGKDVSYPASVFLAKRGMVAKSDRMPA